MTGGYVAIAEVFTKIFIYYVHEEYGTNKKLEIENIFLGLGSNQGDRELNLKNSIKLLNSRVGKVLNTSGIYESEPWELKTRITSSTKLLK